MVLRHVKSHLFQALPKESEDVKQILSDYLKCAEKPIEEIYQSLGTSEQGLEHREERRRLKLHGPNEISHEKPLSWYVLLLKNFTNPFIVLVLVLGCISVLFRQYDAAFIIAFMVVISVLMRFIQEYRSNNAAEKLKALVSTKATVIRHNGGGSKSFEIDMKQLVPGDIVHLSAGDMVPGDVRLISAKGLFVSQSALTGEAMPTEKEVKVLEKPPKSPFDLPNLCFLGTSILNGTALAVILKTGNHTYFGKLARSIACRRPLTNFDIGVNKVSWLLIRFILVVAPSVFLINELSKGDWLQSLLFALSVAVGLAPEMLPMIVTTNLARGAIKMAERKVIVKQLNAIQNFGAINILCTDKTGTLTQDRIILEKHLDPEGRDNEEVLLYGYLNSSFQTGLKNLLDIAVLQHAEMKKHLETYHKVDEIPFDFTRRRMSVVLSKDSEKHLLITKGSIDEILALCTSVKLNGAARPLTSESREKIAAIEKSLGEDGLRVLGVACKEMPPVKEKEYQVKDETDLTFVGFLAFLDPPKPSATEAIASLKTAGVEVKILTGDNEIVTQKICKWVNLKIEGMLLGAEVEAMSDEELKKAAPRMTIFAKMSPLQKSRVILALKSCGNTVGYLGDGINDAPALRAADVGISVDTSVDIAKESSDIIMLQKNLVFLKEGILLGRKTFGNIIKYIKMAFSSNFGNVFSIVGASLIFPFFPMLPVQLLLQNLLYDISQVAIPFDNVDREFLLKPSNWNTKGIAQFMIFIGPISSIFDYAIFAVMWFVFGANTPEKQSLFQAGWFIEGLLSQTLIVHMIRTQKIPFFQSCASLPLLLTTASIMGLGIFIPYSHIGKSIGLSPPPDTYFFWLIAIILAYCFLTQAIKVWFIRKFHYWL
ncbi:MAG: magnesium-translocating P-type ATPase [Chlamydiales bacterium]|nr:magnesium-translocating P-type ATPase [Chlamydiales bacterium]